MSNANLTPMSNEATTLSTFDTACNLTKMCPRDMSIVRIHSMKGNRAIQVNGYMVDFQTGHFNECTIEKP